MKRKMRLVPWRYTAAIILPHPRDRGQPPDPPKNFTGGTPGSLFGPGPPIVPPASRVPSVFPVLVPILKLFPELPDFLVQALHLPLELVDLATDLVTPDPDPLHALRQVVHRVPPHLVHVELPRAGAELHVEVVALTTPDGRDLHRGSGLLFLHLADQLGRVLDLLAVDANDHVPALDPGAVRRASVFHAVDQGA